MLTTILAFIVVLGITVTIHEFGHFAMAKLLKIRVLIFSLGFGPRLIGFTRGDTEYRLSPLPLGGYVKMAGETFDENREGAPDEFQSHPKWHRFLVSLAGPFMNILLAIGIMMVVYMQGVYVPRYLDQPALVGPVVPDSVAQKAGLQTGDEIVSVDGNAVPTWEQMEIALSTAPRNRLNVVVERDGGRIPIHFQPPETETITADKLGFKFTLPDTIVSSVSPDSPAQKAGLQSGDEILSVKAGDKSAGDYDGILNLISRSKGVPLDVTVLRPATEPGPDEGWEAVMRELKTGKVRHLTITPAEEQGRVVIGFYPMVPADHVRYGIGGAIAQSVNRNYDIAALTFRVIGRIFTGSASVKTIGGPIEIARASGDAARTGSVRMFFMFIGLLSLNLGIFNLLPIPILDGGGIALLLVEGILGRDLSLGLKEKIVQVGFVFLILLMGFVVFNDLSRILNFDTFFR